MTSKNESTFNVNGAKTFTGRALHNESGIALISALLFMVVLVSLVPVAIHLTAGEMNRAGDFKENREAFFLAEAGLEHAKLLTEQSSLREALAGPDGLVSATAGAVAANDLDNGVFNVGTQTLLNGNQYSQVSFNGNTYYIRAYDNDDGDPNFDTDNMIFLSAVGIVDNPTAEGTTTTTVEALVHNPPGLPVSAVTTNNDLEAAGNINISGACGGVHSNEDMTVSGGSATIAQGASGTVSATGPGTSTAPTIPIPFIDVTALESYADFILAADGNVYDPSGNFVSSSPWNGWTHTSPVWSKGSPAAVDAFLYIEGNAEIAGNAGSPGSPWNITVVATGYIQVNGSLTIANLKNPSDPVDIQNLFLVAGTDVKYNGNATQNINGIIYATDQLELTGTPNIDGAALAFDASTVEPLVTSNLVSGDVTLSYGCGLTIPSTTVAVEVVSWNEI